MLKENHKETRFHEVFSRVVSGTKGAPREEPFVSKTHRLLPAVMLSVKMARRFIGFTCRVLHHTGSLYQGKETLLTSGSPRRQHNGWGRLRPALKGMGLCFSCFLSFLRLCWAFRTGFFTRMQKFNTFKRAGSLDHFSLLDYNGSLDQNQKSWRRSTSLMFLFGNRRFFFYWAGTPNHFHTSLGCVKILIDKTLLHKYLKQNV